MAVLSVSADVEATGPIRLSQVLQETQPLSRSALQECFRAGSDEGEAAGDSPVPSFLFPIARALLLWIPVGGPSVGKMSDG